jgi:hypothetical protein
VLVDTDFDRLRARRCRNFSNCENSCLRPLLLTLALSFFLAGCSTLSSSRPRPYAMGDRIELGRLVYTVFETRWLPEIGEGPTARIPQNRFFLIRMSVGNTGSGEILLPNVSLEDDQGNSYAELTDGEGVPQFVGMLHPVTTAQPLSGNVLFDAPPQHYRLLLWDQENQHSALVDIPLSFRSETPDVPAPDPK